MLGGHDIPESTIRRRYGRGLVNFFKLYLPLADEWRFYDNSAPGNAILVAQGAGRREVVRGADTWRIALQTANALGTK
jgi:predicted ABC-type ATPase